MFLPEAQCPESETFGVTWNRRRQTAVAALTCTILLSALIAGCGSGDQQMDSSVSTTRPAFDEDTPETVLVPRPDQPAPAADAADPPPMPAMPMTFPAAEDMVFKDKVSTNAEVPTGLDGLVFVDTNGSRVTLKQFINKKNVVLVFTEGFSGMLCPFCKTQTSRLVANYDKFQELDTEILVVYPGERQHVDEFILAARTTGKRQVDKVPFPIVLDQKMAAVDFFEIRSSLAHPSTYVIDKQGNVRLAYVGDDMSADRPSVQALLNILQAADQADQP